MRMLYRLNKYVVLLALNRYTNIIMGIHYNER